jgi:copper(I)-binding protein
MMTPGSGGMMTPGSGGMMTPGSGGMMTPGSGGMMTPGSDGVMTPRNGGMMGTSVAGERGAAYMIIRNSGSEDDALIGASSDIATATEVHESKMDGETVTMQQVERIEVPAQASVELKPGGYHVMFIGLTQELTTGETIEVTLHFERAGDVVVQATVRDA